MLRKLTMVGTAVMMLSWVYACDSGTETNSGGSGGSGASSATGSSNGGAGQGGGSGGEGGSLSVATSSGAGGGNNCTPPDMLIVLDRTMSMHRQPDGTPAPLNDLPSSKWWLAIDAVEALSASYGGGIRFGLELFPLDPGGIDGKTCVTLEERIMGTTATNDQCEQGEVPVQPALNSSAAIAAAIDPQTTLLCRSTPIGDGLTTAIDTLAAIVDPERDQYVMLITDGQDTCSNTLATQQTQTLAQAGVKSYVVGFDNSGSGVDTAQLNDMACAGQTATGFPGNCIDDGMGNYTWDPNGAPEVYLVAENQQQLSAAFDAIAAEVCCDCVD